MVVPFQFRAFNEEITSEYWLPGAETNEKRSVTQRQALSISAGEIPQSREVRRLETYSLREDGVTIRIPDVGEFWCDELGTRIKVSTERNVPESLVSGHLIANAIPAACWLRRRQLLHAAAAVFPGQSSAVVICGPSGSGKSALLKLMLASGASVVCEDVSALDSLATSFLVSGLPGRIQMRTAPHWDQATRTCIEVPEDQQRESAPVGLIMELVNDEALTPDAPQRVDTLDALTILLRNRYRALVPRLLGTEQFHLNSLARLARTIPIYSCSAELARDAGAFRVIEGLTGKV